MWFLARSAFWLGLVFSSMEWPVGAPAIPDARAIASSAASSATTAVASLCATDPRRCFETARKAEALQETLAPVKTTRVH